VVSSHLRWLPWGSRIVVLREHYWVTEEKKARGIWQVLQRLHMHFARSSLTTDDRCADALSRRSNQLCQPAFPDRTFSCVPAATEDFHLYFFLYRTHFWSKFIVDGNPIIVRLLSPTTPIAVDTQPLWKLLGRVFLCHMFLQAFAGELQASWPCCFTPVERALVSIEDQAGLAPKPVWMKTIFQARRKHNNILLEMKRLHQFDLSFTRV
jgi:hypothetical protein